MIRIFHVYFPLRTLLLVFSEAGLGIAVLATAVVVWSGPDAELALIYEGGLFKIGIAVLALVLSMYYYDLYDSLLLSNLAASLTRLVQALGAASLFLAMVYYFVPEIQLGRALLLTWIPVAGVCLAFWRRLFLAVNGSPHLQQRTVLVGEGPLAATLAQEIDKRPELGMKLVGYLSVPAQASGLDGLPCLGSAEEAPEVIRRRRVERVILDAGDQYGGLPVESLLHSKAHGLVVEEAASVYEAITGRVPVEALNPARLLLSDGFRPSPATLFYKRVVSLLGSLIGLALIWPLLLLIAAWVRLDSPGPAIYRQRRIGRDGGPFTLLKFRSMRVGSDAAGPTPTLEHDARITRAGRWLRRMHLDELPQLYNILRGDMYFVGPRPFTVSAEEEYAKTIPFYTQRWNIRPGATGWAQIQRGYCTSAQDNIEKLGYDLFYIKNVSVGLDWLILFHTIKILALGRGAR
jgi:exopolysaccharide biosynthesis polyprenyl glycosylphosphotransferase